MRFSSGMTVWTDRWARDGVRARAALAAAALVTLGLLHLGAPLGLTVSGARADQQRPAAFASLKIDRVEVFRGPAREGAPVWVFLRAGLPVEVLQREAGWSEIRDQEGAVGWAANHHLSARRTASVRASSAARLVLRVEPRESAGAVAQLEPGVLAGVEACDGRWCLLAIGRVKGWLEQSQLWGVTAGEQFD